MKIAEKLILIQEIDADAQVAKHQIKLVQVFGKAQKHVLAFRNLPLASFDKHFLEFFLPILWRQEVERAIEGGLEIDAAGKETGALGIHGSRHEVREVIRRLVGGGRRALRLEIEDVVRLHGGDRALQTIRHDGKLFFHGRIEIRSPVAPRRLQGAVLA